ncbi:unnamed protein product, partial [Mesorhabditis belari]|uniref:Uncharacterized protein n=1 Tax=Mesorhabditis belari TaxID=2138241 RepID=A0AAF3FCX6_9BILA
MNRPPWLLLIISSSLLTCALSIQCYSGSQLQVIECPAFSCIKQTLGTDTVRYCDGSGVSSICENYRVHETCQQIPNIGYICCCGQDLCNSSQNLFTTLSLFTTLFVLFKYL